MIIVSINYINIFEYIDIINYINVATIRSSIIPLILIYLYRTMWTISLHVLIGYQISILNCIFCFEAQRKSIFNLTSKILLSKNILIAFVRKIRYFCIIILAMTAMSFMVLSFCTGRLLPQSQIELIFTSKTKVRVVINT